MATLSTALLILSVLNAVGTGALNADKIKALVTNIIDEHTAKHGDDPSTPLDPEHVAAINAAIPGAIASPAVG